MCGFTTPAPAATIESFSDRVPCLKRKLDDYAAENWDDPSFDLVAVRMRRDDLYSPPPSLPSNSTLHFFVRMLSHGDTVVVHADAGDTVESVHEQILRMTGIPIAEQRLIYGGRQLQWGRTLAEYAVHNDACLHLVGRMRSTDHPCAWQLVNDIVYAVCRRLRDLPSSQSAAPSGGSVLSCIRDFMKATPSRDSEVARGHLQVFSLAGAPSALVMLFLSPNKGNSECAEDSIRLFLSPEQELLLPKCIQQHCAPIVLEFCKLLRRNAPLSRFYKTCRSALGSFLETLGTGHGCHYSDHVHSSHIIHELYPFVAELATPVLVGMESGALSSADVRDFIRFSSPLRQAIEDVSGTRCPMPVGSTRPKCRRQDEDDVQLFHHLFVDMLDKVDKCLETVEFLAVKEEVVVELETIRSRWNLYLVILKELNAISRIYEGGEERLALVLRSRRAAVNRMVTRSERSHDHIWLLHRKDVTDFAARRHLVLMLFPDIRDEFEDLYEMLIDRNQLLLESFEYIRRAETEFLQGGLFVEFKNEEATGPGVLREWFYLVCQAMFNPQNGLFLPSQKDCRKFFPNPASGVNPLHLDYFGFSGRIIALALMHRVQVGIMFDRVFFLQLSGNSIALNDIQDADPVLYRSCKEILDYDAAFVDSDALGLTFVREIEELGSHRVVELCPGGEGISVDSRNREHYVNLLIEHRFVTSVSDQISRFIQGFSDILSGTKLQKLFFQSLDLEDFDTMLYGSDKVICVKEWIAHTEYNGYEWTDCQIQWFWKTVENMSSDQKRILLYFWTAVNYLPFEGFRGLGSKLCIFKDVGSVDRLPSSHTCFYRLCLPPYTSMSVMQDRLSLITQETVSRSFGTW